MANILQSEKKALVVAMLAEDSSIRVLETPPIKSALDAVSASIVADAKNIK